MNLMTRLRDWWHRPVTDRLDRIERNTRPRQMSVEKPDRSAVRDLNEAMTGRGRGSWKYSMPPRE